MHFVEKVERDRQMDRQTDGHRHREGFTIIPQAQCLVRMGFRTMDRVRAWKEMRKWGQPSDWFLGST